MTQLKRIIRWLIRIFFASSVGFNVPIKKMLSLEAFLNGLVLGAVPGILCKVVSGLAGRNKWKSLGERQRASKASIMTRFGLVQPIQYLVGMAMVARGEFAFLVALSASKMTLPDAEDGGSGGVMLREEVYAALTWGLVWALVLAPFLFKWALSVYMSASPIQRGMSIGGLTAAERNFVIQVIGQHHSGVLHEILNAIHGEGMDVLECRVETDGEVDTNYFVVQSRGKQKDFDDEKLEEIRHHIQEILGDENAVVMFEAIDDEDFTFAAIELQVVTASADQGEEGAVHVVSKVTKRLQELGLDVEEIDEQHKVQIDHGHETEMERDLFYAVPSKNSEEEDTITHRRVHQVKRALQSMLRDENIKAEVVVKPVADRSKGFSELQTFDPQQAISRAKGEVWELMCIGAHDVELLSTAVRKLEPLGLRLLHAAHSHTDKTEGEGADAQQQCSRIFVERRQEAAAGRDSKSEGEIYEETEEFTAKVIRVMKATYKSDDDNKFTVRPVESSALEEMSFMTRSISAAVVPGLQDLPGLVKPSPDFNEFRRGLPRGLKQIPEREPRSPMEMAFDGDGLLGGSNGPSGGATPYGEGAKTPTKPREGRRPSVPSIDPQTMTRVQELEAKARQRRPALPARRPAPFASPPRRARVPPLGPLPCHSVPTFLAMFRHAHPRPQVAILEALNSRVNRLEELELRIKHGGARPAPNCHRARPSRPCPPRPLRDARRHRQARAAVADRRRPARAHHAFLVGAARAGAEARHAPPTPFSILARPPKTFARDRAARRLRLDPRIKVPRRGGPWGTQPAADPFAARVLGDPRRDDSIGGLGGRRRLRRRPPRALGVAGHRHRHRRRAPTPREHADPQPAAVAHGPAVRHEDATDGQLRRRLAAAAAAAAPAHRPPRRHA